MGRETPRRPGSPRLLLLPALLLLASGGPALGSPQEDPPPVPMATWSAGGYEDRAFGFRVDRPPAPWEFRRWNNSWAGPVPPTVAFSHPTGAVLAVYARDGAGRDPAEHAPDLAHDLHMEAPEPRAIRETEVAGEPGVRFSMRVTRGDHGLPVHALVSLFVKEGVCFALVAHADGQDRLEAHSAELLSRFRLLPAGGYRWPGPPVDVDGAGWRVRGGVAEHSAVGVRVPLGTCWRVSVTPRAPETLAFPSLNLESPLLGLAVHLQGVAIENRSWEEVEALAKEEFDLRHKGLKDEPWFKMCAGGGPVDFTWRYVRARNAAFREGKKVALSTTLRGDGRLVLVDILLPGSEDPRVPAAARDLLHRLHVLSPEERSALVAGMGNQVDAQAFVGRDEYVRKGAYVSYPHRILWRKPSPLWTILPGEQASDPVDTVAVLFEEENGTNARLLTFKPRPGDTKWALHEGLVEVLKEVLDLQPVSKPVAASLGSRDALRSDFRASILGVRLRVAVITTNPIGPRGYGLVVASKDGAGVEAAVEAAVRGLRFQVEEFPRPRRTARGWEDPGYGFRVDAPPGAFKAGPAPSAGTDAAGAVVSVEAGGERLVIAAREWPQGDPETERSAVRRVLAALDPGDAAGGRLSRGEEAAGTLAGRPSRDLVFAGSPALRISRIRSGGFLYVAGTSSPAGGDAAGPLSWFRLLE